MSTDTALPAKPQRIPLSQQAQRYLRGLIDAGAYRPGDQLPSQAELANQLGISRLTLREALLALEQDGVIVLRQGVGTFIAPDPSRKLESGLERLESVMELAAHQGLQAKCEGLMVSAQPANQDEANALEVALGTELTRVRRVIAVGGTPAAYMVDVASASVLEWSEAEERFQGSVLDLLRHRTNGRIAQAVAGITAVTAGDELGELLRVRPEQPLLLLEETLFSVDGTPLEYSRNYFVPEYFRFHVVRR
jgi:GntR family transcriptional regulator